MRNITQGQPETGNQEETLKIWQEDQNNLVRNLKKIPRIIPD